MRSRRRSACNRQWVSFCPHAWRLAGPEPGAFETDPDDSHCSAWPGADIACFWFGNSKDDMANDDLDFSAILDVAQLRADCRAIARQDGLTMLEMRGALLGVLRDRSAEGRLKIRQLRSEDRRVGKGGVKKCRSR